MEFLESLPVNFKEIAPNNSIPEKWKEIVLNTGGSHSTLQDIKLPQKAGGYWYKSSDEANTRNRFIYWQTTSDSIEFSESSLDVNLTSGHLRCKVAAGTPPLNGMSVHERTDTRNVVILAATVSSVHRMVFPHPDVLDRKATYGSLSKSTPSIFHDTSSINNPNNYHVLNQYSTPNGGVAHTCASMLRDSGEAVFVLALGGGAGAAEGGVLLVRLPLAGPASTTMLQRESNVPRFLSGITTALRGWGERVETYGAALTSTLALGVSGDGCVRAWQLDAPAQPVAVTAPLANVCARPPPHGHGLRLCEEAGGAVVAAFLACGAESQFAVLRLRGSGADARFTQLATIYGPQLELVDFAIGRREEGYVLWALWSQPTGESLITCTAVGPEARWQAVSPRQPAPPLPTLSSPQQYCARLLAPGLFCAPIVRKALSIYRRRWGGGEAMREDTQLSEACMNAVGARLRQLTARAPQQDHSQLMHKCWSDLYSWCVQYLEGLQKPLGFMLTQHEDDCGSGIGDSNGGWWCAVVRRAGVALVRQLEPLERIMLSIEPHTEIENCVGLSSDAARVVVAGATWERLAGGAGSFPGGAVSELERLLFAGGAPQHRLLPRLLHLLTSSDTLPALTAQQVEQVTSVLRPIRDLQSAVLELNDALRLDVPEVDTMSDDDEEESSSDYDNLFASDLGVSVLTESIRQMAEMRCVVVGGALAALALWRGAEGVPGVGHCAVHWQAYRALLWLRAQPTHNNAMSESFRLKLSSLGAEPVTLIDGGAGGVVWAYSKGEGGRRARRQLQAAQAPTMWPRALPLLTHHLAHQLWAVSGGFQFGWWLARVNQPRLVHSYVTMLEPWCEWNACCRQFILGLALLDLGDQEGAYSAFCKAAKGVSNEPFLRQLICSQDSRQTLTQHQALVLYYMKVIKLLEIHEAGACVVRLAETAIGIADRDDPNLPMFQWLVFKWHLSEGRVQRALSAAAACRAPPARAAAAAALLTELGRRGELGALVGCGALGAEAERAASSRAKLHDPHTHNPHYDFLYALHVSRHHYRKAAAVAYERATRCEAGGEARRRWLAAALTALRLASPQHAFLATHNMQVIGPEELAAELREEDQDFLSPIEQALIRGGEIDLDLLYEQLMVADAATLLTVLTRALAASQFLPKWFLDRYMEVDSAGLVRALLRSGRAGEAGEACAHALRASLQSLGAHAPPNAAPLALADTLLLELEHHRDQPYIKQVYEDLEQLTREYTATATRISRDMKQLAGVPV